MKSKEYPKLWHEYAESVSDSDLVYQYALQTVGINDYRLYISYARWVEKYQRQFDRANGIFVEGLKLGLNDKIISDQYR